MNYELEELISEVGFDIVKANAVIAGFEEFRKRKFETLLWLQNLKD
jgi:hypothetical protein